MGQAVISLKAKIKAAKKNLRNTVANEKATKAKMRDNKATLVKITGKKQPVTAVKPRGTARFAKNQQLSFSRSNKILNLENRLARTISYIKYAKKQKDKMAAAFMKHLRKRASRLAKRLHRKHKQLMRVLIRKQRTKPRFVEFWKKAAKRVYALSKADEPI